MLEDPLSERELRELEGLAKLASPAPWQPFTGAAIGGPDFIRIGGDDDGLPDLYVQHGEAPAPVADLDFIAAARNYVPRLVAEVRRHRGA